MPQEVILRKFIRFLDLTEPQLIKQLENEFPTQSAQKIKELHEHMEKLRFNLKGGHCFSFAVIHGAMDEIGKLPWWEEALTNIVNWDETAKTLDDTVELSGAETEAFWQSKKEKDNEQNEQSEIDRKKIKLKTIFERALPYLIHHQATTDSEFKIKNLNQDTLLSPVEIHFEILDQGKIKRIQDRKIMAGTFNKDELLNLLNEKILVGNIVLIQRGNHAIRISYKDGKWLLYNPNYDHKELTSIHKVFTDKSEFVDEIIRIQGQSIAIQVGSFNSKKIDLGTIQNLPPEEMEKKLQGQGLSIIARFTPNILPKALDQAIQAPNGLATIISALSAADGEGWTGLHAVARYVPDALEKILAQANKTPQGLQSVASALQMQTKEGWTGLHMVARYAPDALEKVLELAAKTPQGWQAIASALQMQTKDGATAYEMIAKNADVNYLLPEVLQLAGKAVDGGTGLHVLARYASNTLYKLLDKAKKNPEQAEILVSGLQLQNHEGWTGLHMIAYYAKNALPDILDLAIKTSNGPVILAASLQAQTKEGQTGLHMLADYAPNLLPKVLTEVAKAPHGSEAIAAALVTKDQSGKSGFQMLLSECPQKFIPTILEHAPHLLPDALAIIRTMPKGRQLFATALAYQDNENGVTGLHAIMKNKQTQRFLATVLELAVPEQDTSAKSSQNSATLTREQFIKAVHNYESYKNKYSLFNTKYFSKWHHISKESIDLMVKLNSASSDEMRFNLAKDYISQHSEKAFANALMEVMGEKVSAKIPKNRPR